MVGDNLDYDIAPCRPLGIYSLWVKGKKNDSKTLDGIRPDKTISSVLEIPGLLIK
jgi:FMN phosphatase YigB (HAD superfamily)